MRMDARTFGNGSNLWSRPIGTMAERCSSRRPPTTRRMLAKSSACSSPTRWVSGRSAPRATRGLGGACPAPSRETGGHGSTWPADAAGHWGGNSLSQVGIPTRYTIIRAVIPTKSAPKRTGIPTPLATKRADVMENTSFCGQNAPSSRPNYGTSTIPSHSPRRAPPSVAANAGPTLGVVEAATSPIEEMDAFDALPREVREALDHGVKGWCAVDKHVAVGAFNSLNSLALAAGGGGSVSSAVDTRTSTAHVMPAWEPSAEAASSTVSEAMPHRSVAEGDPVTTQGWLQRAPPMVLLVPPSRSPFCAEVPVGRAELPQLPRPSG